MKMKRLISLLVVLSMLAIVVVGCGSSNTPAQKTTSGSSASASVGSTTGDKQSLGDSVTIWMKKHQVDSMNGKFEEKCKEIEKSTGTKINVEIIAYEDFPQKWAAAIESGAVPDLSFMTYAEVGMYHEDGLLMDVTDAVTKIQEDNEPMYKSLMSPLVYDNKFYMIPMWTESQILYYRTDLIKTPPTTWEELRATAKAVTDPSKGIYGLGMGFGKGNSDAEWLTRAMLWANGASLVDKDGKAAINSPEAKEVAQYIYDMFTVDKSIPPSAANWDDAGNNQAYISGQAAMIFNTGSVVNSLKNDHPDLYEKTALAPFPSGTKGQFVPGIDDGLVIFKNAKNPEGGKALAGMLMEKNWYLSWLEDGAPLCLPVYENSSKTGIWAEETRFNKPFVDQIPAFQFIGYPQQYNSKAGKVYNLRIVNDTFQKILSGAPIDSSLKWAEDEINKVYGN